MMSDLDLLVPKDRIYECEQLLKTNGFKSLPIDTPSRHHLRPLYRNDYPCRIELHHRIAVPALTNMLHSADILAASRLMVHKSSRFRLSSPTHFLIHNIIHHQLKDKRHRYHSFRLYQCYDTVLLMNTFYDEVDWGRLAHVFGRFGYTRALKAYFVLLQNLFDQPPPPAVNLAGWSRFEWPIYRAKWHEPPFLAYYLNILIKLTEHSENRKAFLRVMLTPQDYLRHFRRLKAYLR
jgi:hypothetical protein